MDGIRNLKASGMNPESYVESFENPDAAVSPIPRGLTTLLSIQRRPTRRTDPGRKWRSDEGQTAVELAFALPLLLLLLFAIVDFSLLFFVYHSMENGISEATRYGLTGQQKEDPGNPGYNLSRQDSMKLIMRESSPNIVLDDSAFTFEHLNGSVWAAGTGGAGDISRMTVNYNWRPITPFMSVLFTGGQIPLRVSSTVKNEGFPTP
jgi:Flp pilus assembly protein TadG